MVEQLFVSDTDEEPVAQEGDGATTEAERKRERSTIAFPYSDLDSAMSVATMVHARGGGQCELVQLAAWMGHDTVTSGAFSLKVTAARLFGLIEGDRQQVRLTALGKEAIDPALERRARAKAFLNVPLYNRIYEEHKGGLLPPDIGLEREMRSFGVAEKQTDKARQTFARSAQQAGFFASGRTRLVMPGGVDPIGPHVQPETRRDHGKTEPRTNAVGPGGTGGGSGMGDNWSLPPGLHPAIVGLLQTLPQSGAEWPQERRSVWLNAAEMLFKLIYTDSTASD